MKKEKRPMKKEVIIHIGTPKTGTTAVQLECENNKDSLIRSGILYSKTGHDSDIYSYGQHLLSHAFFARSNLADYGKKTTDEIWSDLVNEINNSPCEKILISSEDFIYIDETAIEYIKAALSDFNVRGFVTIRPQTEFIISSYAQAIKDKQFSQGLNEYISHDIEARRFFFGEHIGRWSSAFPSSLMLYRDFPNHESLIDEFFGRIGLIKPADFHHLDDRANVSLNSLGIVLLRRLNLANVASDVYEKIRNEIALICSDRYISIDKICDKSTFERILSVYEDDILLVKSRLTTDENLAYSRRLVNRRLSNNVEIEEYFARTISRLRSSCTDELELICELTDGCLDELGV